MESRVTILALGLAISAVSCTSSKKMDPQPGASQPPAASADAAQTTGKSPNLRTTAASAHWDTLALHKRHQAQAALASTTQAGPDETASRSTEERSNNSQVAAGARPPEGGVARESVNEADNASGGQSAPSSTSSSSAAPRVDKESEGETSRNWSLLGFLGLVGLAGLLGGRFRRAPQHSGPIGRRVRVYDSPI